MYSVTLCLDETRSRIVSISCVFYREMLQLEMRWKTNNGPTDWEIALWLTDPIPGAKEPVSQLVGIFLL